MWGATSELSDSFSGFPYGIYTIPEISMVGYTEAQLTQEKVPYELGIARYLGRFYRNRGELRRRRVEMQ
jgi:NAD(P) transhydrogenase